MKAFINHLFLNLKRTIFSIEDIFRMIFLFDHWFGKQTKQSKTWIRRKSLQANFFDKINRIHSRCVWQFQPRINAIESYLEHFKWNLEHFATVKCVSFMAIFGTFALSSDNSSTGIWHNAFVNITIEIINEQLICEWMSCYSVTINKIHSFERWSIDRSIEHVCVCSLPSVELNIRLSKLATSNTSIVYPTHHIHYATLRNTTRHTFVRRLCAIFCACLWLSFIFFWLMKKSFDLSW